MFINWFDYCLYKWFYLYVHVQSLCVAFDAPQHGGSATHRFTTVHRRYKCHSIVAGMGRGVCVRSNAPDVFDFSFWIVVRDWNGCRGLDKRIDYRCFRFNRLWAHLKLPSHANMRLSHTVQIWTLCRLRQQPRMFPIPKHRHIIINHIEVAIFDFILHRIDIEPHVGTDTKALSFWSLSFDFKSNFSFG